MKLNQLNQNRALTGLLVVAIAVGIGFRCFNLEQKIYWHDEVYTTMRAAGFTRYNIDQEIFQNQIFTAADLQKFQRPAPASTAADTLYSLAVEDPQHPPLYFLLARGWLQAFGSSLTATRSLAVLLGLLGLPLMYGLAIELFESPTTALLATALLALSPFDTLFAQTARQYSLLTTSIIGSSWFLLRAIRLSTWRSWGLFSLSGAIGLYTHPFFGLTLVGQGVYVLFLKTGTWAKRWRNYWSYLLSIVGMTLIYLPWVWVMIANHQRAASTTDWTRTKVTFLYLLKLWILSFTSIFIDLDLGLDHPGTYVLRVPFMILIGVAMYYLYRQSKHAAWSFVLTSSLVPFLILVVPDLLVGGKRSAVSRYLISCLPGVQLAVAYFFTQHQRAWTFLWRGGLVLLLSASIVSCGVSALADTWWSKDLSFDNAEVIRQINRRPQSKVLSDIGDDYTNTGDLISLSYGLRPQTQLLLLRQPPDLSTMKAGDLLFRPSVPLRKALKEQNWQMKVVFLNGRLWEVQRSSKLD
jgi:uncharacterized membrane protein